MSLSPAEYFLILIQTKKLPMKKLLILSFLAILLFSCSSPVENQSDEPLITKNQLELSSDIMTPEVLWSFGRLGDVQVSPSGEKILYGVSYYKGGGIV